MLVCICAYLYACMRASVHACMHVLKCAYHQTCIILRSLSGQVCIHNLEQSILYMNCEVVTKTDIWLTSSPMLPSRTGFYHLLLHYHLQSEKDRNML